MTSEIACSGYDRFSKCNRRGCLIRDGGANSSEINTQGGLSMRETRVCIISTSSCL